jgi:hypothetical protein
MSDSGPRMSEIVLSRLKFKISAYGNEFAQNQWFFTILPNTSYFAYFKQKCGGLLELTPYQCGSLHRESEIDQTAVYSVHQLVLV